jgi:hypothetical protein
LSILETKLTKTETEIQILFDKTSFLRTNLDFACFWLEQVLSFWPRLVLCFTPTWFSHLFVPKIVVLFLLFEYPTKSKWVSRWAVAKSSLGQNDKTCSSQKQAKSRLVLRKDVLSKRICISVSVFVNFVSSIDNINFFYKNQPDTVNPENYTNIIMCVFGNNLRKTINSFIYKSYPHMYHWISFNLKKFILNISLYSFVIPNPYKILEHPLEAMVLATFFLYGIVLRVPV